MKPNRIFVITLLIGLLGAALEVTASVAQINGAAPNPIAKKHPLYSGISGVNPRPAAGPQSLLERAIIGLDSCDSISAKIRQSVGLFGKRLDGSGSYLEQRSPQGLMFRLELRFQFAEKGATLLQVCDGRYLWIYEDSRDRPTVAQVDVTRIARVLEEMGDLPHTGRVGHWPGLGGLPKTLRGLHLAFDFTAAEEARLEDQLPVIRLQGQWKQARLIQMLPERAEAIKAGNPVDLGKLPPHLPHYVVLFLEQGRLFPRRIEYWRSPPASPRPKEPSENQLLLKLELFDVQVNVPIDRARFLFDPGKLNVANQTDRFLQDLKRKDE